MARNKINTLLGYEDEFITDKNKGLVNFTTNKIGGKPDWPSDVSIDPPSCPLCQLPRLLVVQVYAPLENSTYHRTLYIFTCINPNCWNQNESWICIRSQTIEQVNQLEATAVVSKPISSATDWCQDADEWDDDNNANISEENGNLINNIAERVSDEDDESFSFEDSVCGALGNLSVDEKNANNGYLAEAQGGAVGRLNSPAATAEIEGNEGEVISIDTPTLPQKDITALLQEVTPLPQDLCRSNMKRAQNLHFVSYFMSVSEETQVQSVNISDRHVRELLQEYQINNEDGSFMNVDGAAGGGGGEATLEKYEKSAPAHGDKMFHYFSSKIQMNPGHLIRYNRESSSPLLLYPLHDVPRKCQYCQDEMIFEFQILPTLIPKLRLVTDVKEGPRVEFGNVLIFTCRQSCWSTASTVKQEGVVVQAEVY